jgi:hypothetical protein
MKYGLSNPAPGRFRPDLFVVVNETGERRRKRGVSDG